jgi:hypothetical protein
MNSFWVSGFIEIAWYLYLLFGGSIFISLILIRLFRSKTLQLLIILSSSLIWVIATYMLQSFGFFIYRKLKLKWWMVVLLMVLLALVVPKPSIQVDYFTVRGDNFECKCMGYEYINKSIFEGKSRYCFGIPYACEQYE